MDAFEEVNVYSESDEKQELIDYINIVFRRPYVVRQRPNHIEYWGDDEFFKRFRFTKDTVMYLLEYIEDEIRFPTNRNNVINPLQQLLICLRFYATGNMLLPVGDFAGVVKSTVSLTVRRVTSALCELKNIYLTFPDEDEKLVIQQGFYNIAVFPRVLLALDCTHIRIQSSGGDNAELFRNRKGYFSLNVQAACDHSMKFRDIVARWPGSSHDSNIFNNSQLKARFENGEGGNCFILGDSGYPALKYLMTPVLNPVTAAENLYNESQIRTRNIIERAFGVWKRRFPVLAWGLRLKTATTQDIIIATAILHNIAVDRNEEVPEDDDEIQQLIDEAMHDVHYNNTVGNIARNELILNYFARL